MQNIKLIDDQALATMSIVLVEPSTTQQKIIKEHINALGVHYIEIAETGHSALEMIKIEKPELVISAMYLPDMLGTDLLYTIREHQALKETAFLLISSETNINKLEPVRQGGTIAILPKPFDSRDLRCALQSTVDYYADDDPIEFDAFEAESLNVLVVDDSLTSRNHIKHILNNMGIAGITTAKDGQEAINLIKEHFYDLIVTDYNMPHVDGEALVNYVRNESQQSSVPILMITSEQNESRLKSVRQSGVSAMCDKPFDPRLIRSLIEDIYP